MNRRNFLGLATLGAVALASASRLPAQVSKTGIVRRHDYKRRRWYKRRDARRHPIPRVLKEIYSNIRLTLTPAITPLVDQMGWSSKRWSGTNYYYDVVTI